MKKTKQLLKLNKKLLAFVDSEFKLKVTEREAGAGLIDVSAFLFAKSTKTFGALNMLCHGSFGQDAAILARSLLENVINLAYIEKNESQHRAKLFICYSLLDNRKKLEQIKDDTDVKEKREDMEKKFYDKYGKVLEEISENHKQECKKIRSIGKQQRKNSWSCLSIRDMAIETGLKELYYKKIYWLISQFVHSHVGASGSYLKEEKDGQMTIIDGPSEDWVEESLVLGFDCYLRILHLVNEILKLGFEDEIKEIEKKYAKISGK